MVDSTISTLYLRNQLLELFFNIFVGTRFFTKHLKNSVIKNVYPGEGQCYYHFETSTLTHIATQLTGFYVMGITVFNVLIK